MVAAQEMTLQQVLEGKTQYLVPLYQRPYQWGKLQLGQLWEDVMELAEDRAGGERPTHFMGSLVLAPPPANVAGGISTYLVVDGQQRLTTLTLLLAAIRDHLEEAEPDNETSAEIHDSYLVNPYKKGNQHIKLVPTQEDRAAYNTVIRRLPGSGSSDTIGEAYRFFRGKLAALETPERPMDMTHLLSSLTEGLTLVSISTHPDDNVHRIFQSLNNTGLKLTQGDLLRNYIFMRLPDTGEEAYDRYWKPLQDTLDNDLIEELFWIDLAADHPTAKIGDTYVFQQRRMDRLPDETAIKEELERLTHLAGLYRLVLEPGQETNPEIRLRLQHLHQWGATTTHPVILRILRARADQLASEQETAQALLILESYLVRRLLSGRASTGLNRTLRSLVSAITDEEPVDVQISRYLSSRNRHFVDDAALRTAIHANPFYRSGRAQQRKVFLRWLEEAFGSREPIDTSTLSIEHVMPQTLSPAWRQHPEDTHPGQDIDELHDSLVHTLGNLTLTGYNSALSNRDFGWKRAEMLKSGLRLSASVTEQDHWGPQKIRDRADLLADLIIATWPGPMNTRESENIAPVWQRLHQLLAVLPSDRWTSYGDIAAAIGSAAQPVGNYLAGTTRPNAHRVLRRNGEISQNFRWTDPGDTRDPREIMQAEGIHFTDAGLADPSQRLTADDLLDLLEAVDGAGG